VSDRKRAKQPPPPDDDPALIRTCTRCGTQRQWVVARCPACCNPEFSLLGEGGIKATKKPAKSIQDQRLLF